MNKYTFLIIITLLLGTFYKLSMTANNKFIFNMDNARDFVDVREMVVLKKPRLIGPTSAIEGLYNGPAWYYLLSVPFVLSNGHPYSGVILVIALWAVGGYFLLKTASKLSFLPFISVALIWIFSNFIGLATLYSYNPNPLPLLMPLFIYLGEKYFLTNKLRYSLGLWLLAGFFFNCEMNFGIILPFIIISATVISGRTNLLKTKKYWLGAGAFIVTLMPQVVFDLKHQFIMSQAVINYLFTATQNTSSLSLPVKFLSIYNSFMGVFNGTFGNSGILTKAVTILSLALFVGAIKNRHKSINPLLSFTLGLIIIPFIFYVLAPTNLNPWHIGGSASAIIVMTAILMNRLGRIHFAGHLINLLILFLIINFSYNNFSDFIKDKDNPSNDASSFSNELAAVDYVFQKADGLNFKVYTFLPSVIDYPYQYTLWWRGVTKYGYIPEEYAYQPNKPPYISNKVRLSSVNVPPTSNLVFLIKEPDRNNLRHLWENSFTELPLVHTEHLGPITVETRKDVKNNLNLTL